MTEAIQTYFNDDIDVEVIVDDINCALEEQRDYYLGRAESSTLLLLVSINKSKGIRHYVVNPISSSFGRHLQKDLQ